MIAEIAALFLAAQSAPDFAPLVVGESAIVSVLDEEREINVVLPAGYADEPERQWPVVIMLDGGGQQDLMLGVGIHNWNRLWGRSKEAIWVGIETKDRQRELLPPTRDAAEQERYPTAGESAVFRDWLIDTILPLIAARYRGNGEVFLVGESAAGHFAVETWASGTDAFSGYAAISPSFQWDEQSLSHAISGQPANRAPLYVSLADEGGATEEGILRLVAALPDDQSWCFSDRREDLVHANSLHGLLPEALQFLMPTPADWLEEYGFVLRCEKRGLAAE
ncbi:alpha/beta hydrolase [Erythrobacter sp. SCSIO 43205]|uniref:alpha/beta hydrolase n=1 Tax=Erythrobacter sp. SCSIO 43205 TaxID=2779361 RepID=UPI001CA9D32A|nr:alpha/beta hydrolase-fold protein [Erythrobacter sp. SCSIO 43205]UAB76900.1 alpha/beta hydrolase [Erythrobacter sp. SCSIO 43205]